MNSLQRSWVWLLLGFFLGAATLGLGVFLASKRTPSTHMRLEATIAPSVSPSRVIDFLADSAGHQEGITRVELNTKDRKLFVEFADVGPDSVACRIYEARESEELRSLRTLFSDYEVFFNPASCV